MAELRQRGLTYADIGRRLEVTAQAVQSTLQRAATKAERSVPCGRCGRPMISPVALPRRAGQALCRACLARLPRAPFGRRLLSQGLAAGLTAADLARRADVQLQRVDSYDFQRQKPRPAVLARLVRALGPDLVGRLLQEPRGRGAKGK
jgi:transcriptional regulator with XRE-family HTH domain